MLVDHREDHYSARRDSVGGSTYPVRWDRGERPWTIREKQIAGLLSTQPPFSSQHPENALPLARFLMDDDTMGDLLGVERV